MKLEVPNWNLEFTYNQITMNKGAELIPMERIQNFIFLIRGEKVMLDSHLAELYGVETRLLIQAAKRNADRFPDDFTFQLTPQEVTNLRSQIVISSWRPRQARAGT